MLSRIRGLLLLVLLVTGILTAQLHAFAISGQEVLDNIEEAMQADTAYIKARMVLYSASNETREREMEIHKSSMEGNKALIRFLAPASVEGTSFLTLEREDSIGEDMYLYLPVLGSVRKIASSQKNGSFVGTDFSFNDIKIVGGGEYNNDYRAEVIEQKKGEIVLKLIPKDEDIDYSFVKMWVNREKWYPLKSEFYNKNGEISKILKAEDITRINGYYTAQKVTMSDVFEGTRTKIRLNEIRYDIEIDHNYFTVRYLRR